MDLIITVLPVVTNDLPISSRFTSALTSAKEKPLINEEPKYFSDKQRRMGYRVCSSATESLTALERQQCE